jgi:hypothetical protein
MTPFPLYSVRNDFDSAVFLFVNITSFSSIPPAVSMNSCISIPSLVPDKPNMNSLAAPNHLSLRAFPPTLSRHLSMIHPPITDPLSTSANLQCSSLITRCYYFFVPLSFFPHPSSRMSNGSRCPSGPAPHAPNYNVLPFPCLTIALLGVIIFPK